MRCFNALLFVASFHLLRPFIVFIYTSIEHDVEVWACLQSDQDRNAIAESLCKELRAARYLVIAVFVLGVVILALIAWLRFGASKRQNAPNENVVDSATQSKMKGEA